MKQDDKLMHDAFTADVHLASLPYILHITYNNTYILIYDNIKYLVILAVVMLVFMHVVFFFFLITVTF